MCETIANTGLGGKRVNNIDKGGYEATLHGHEIYLHLIDWAQHLIMSNISGHFV